MAPLGCWGNALFWVWAQCGARAVHIVPDRRGRAISSWRGGRATLPLLRAGLHAVASRAVTPFPAVRGVGVLSLPWRTGSLGMGSAQRFVRQNGLALESGSSGCHRWPRCIGGTGCPCPCLSVGDTYLKPSRDIHSGLKSMKSSSLDLSDQLVIAAAFPAHNFVSFVLDYYSNTAASGSSITKHDYSGTGTQSTLIS